MVNEKYHFSFRVNIRAYNSSKFGLLRTKWMQHFVRKFGDELPPLDDISGSYHYSFCVGIPIDSDRKPNQRLYQTVDGISVYVSKEELVLNSAMGAASQASQNNDSQQVLYDESRQPPVLANLLQEHGDSSAPQKLVAQNDGL